MGGSITLPLSYLLIQIPLFLSLSFASFKAPATSYIYTLSLHDALPISFRPLLPRGDGHAGLIFELALHALLVARRRKEIGRAHVWTPVTDVSRMPSSA